MRMDTRFRNLVQNAYVVVLCRVTNEHRPSNVLLFVDKPIVLCSAYFVIVIMFHICSFTITNRLLLLSNIMLHYFAKMLVYLNIEY
jgi:hypothetical protein